jgi:hypothetical protein
MPVPQATLNLPSPEFRISRRALLKNSATLALATTTLPTVLGMAVEKTEAGKEKVRSQNAMTWLRL